MTTTIQDGDIELKPEDAPQEWMAFKREARFKARMREGHSATIELFPLEATASRGRAFLRCDGLCIEEDDCDDLAVAIVSDQHEIDGRRSLCEVHFSMYLSEVLPAVSNWEQAFLKMARNA